MQRFIGCLNYVIGFFPKLWEIHNPLFQRLKKKPPAMSQKHTQIVKYIESKAKSLSCLGMPLSHAFIIIETNASVKAFGEILKQRTISKVP